MNGFIGEGRVFAGTFAPRNWAFCQGQLLAISQNTALFSILGTTYGGDGRTSFALPDLRGRVAVGPGTGPGLPTIRLGQRFGMEQTFLNLLNLPSHNHTTSANIVAAPGDGVTGVADNNSLAHQARGNTVPLIYNDAAPSIDMNAAGVSVTVGMTGNNQSLENRSPYLPIYYVICMQGTFPSRN